MSASLLDRGPKPRVIDPIPRSVPTAAFQTSTTATQGDALAPAYDASVRRRWVEPAVAAVALAMLSPVMLGLLLLVRGTSRGPAIYRQRRLGRNGRVFEILKLRSMTVDAENGTGAVWAEPNDPRVTPIGKWLRLLHLDELPQLWNIARGEMAFVGPRPERPEIAAELAVQIPGYGQRMAVLPGVTGLAQVNLAPDTTTDCVRRKLELDLEYVYTASLSLDVRLVACTLLKMTGMPRAMVANLALVRRIPRVRALAADSATPSAARRDRGRVASAAVAC
ncbi:MAG: sugar transferase [Lacipirellulaceae bacterium]